MSEETKNKKEEEKTKNQENKETPIYINGLSAFFSCYINNISQHWCNNYINNLFKLFNRFK